MTDQYRRLQSALLAAGFVMRRGKHQVWHHTQHGVVVVLSNTPSDNRSYLNDRAVVRRAMREIGAEVTV